MIFILCIVNKNKNYEVKKMSSKIQPYAENGILVSKTSITVGDDITLSYDGLLADSGADKIFAYVGYGGNWEEKGFIPMENEGGVFKAAFKILLPGVLNISFKDSADNWDNNSLNNYTFTVGAKKAKATTKTDEEKKTEVKKTAVKTTSKAKVKTTEEGAEKPAAKKTTSRKKKKEE